MEIARSLTLHASVPKKFWTLAVHTAVFITNRLTSKSLPRGIPPVEAWEGYKPKAKSMKVFGKSRKGVFMGYDTHSHGYLIYMLDTQKLISTRNAIFNEVEFPFKTTVQTQESIVKEGSGIEFFAKVIPTVGRSSYAKLFLFRLFL